MNAQVTAYTIVSETVPATCSRKVEELLKDEWVLHGPLNVVKGVDDVFYVQAMAKVKLLGPPPGMLMEMPGARIIGR